VKTVSDKVVGHSLA